MAWEERNGRRYYYRKRRIGKTVISEYVGVGWIGEAAAAMDALDLAEQRSKQQAWQREQSEYMEAEREVRQLGELTRMLTRATFLLAGYHPHKGQWRKRRNEKRN
jgi:hypothetical protein